MWTHFWDMNSGGGTKEKWQHIYIEAPEDEAKIIFYNKFGHNPDRVSCTCCGSDYSISSDKDLAQLTAYHRGCKYTSFLLGKEVSEDQFRKVPYEQRNSYIGKYIEESNNELGFFSKKFLSLEDYIKQEDVLIIKSEDIKDEERVGDVPEQGYIWID